MGDDRGYSSRRNRIEGSVLEGIALLYPSHEYFVQDTSFARTFEDSPIRDLILELALEDDLALHLVSSPDFLIVPRGSTADLAEQSIYIKVFAGKISLTQREIQIYQKNFPLDKLLFIAFKNPHPEAQWASVFLETGAVRIE